jgi:hypothetical protein
MAHGFELEMLAKLVADGLAGAEAHNTILGRTMTGRRNIKVTWMQIAESGRKAILE